MEDSKKQEKQIRINQSTINESVYLAKGVCILLVVVGHFGMLGDPFYRSYFHGPIYAFHMALFMLLSGYLYGLSAGNHSSFGEYSGFVKKKFQRLMYPYITVTILFLLVKYPAGRFFHLTYPVDSDVLYYIFLNPSGGFSYMLWFIYTLFIIFSIFPLFRGFFRNDLLILGITVVLSFLPWPRYLCLNLVFDFLPFFAVGYVVALRGLLKVIAPEAGFLVFLVSFVSIYLFSKTPGVFSPYITQVFAELNGLTGSMMVVFLCVTMVKRKFLFAGVFKSLGIYSSSIYFLHTITMSSLAIVLTQVIGIEGGYILLTILIITAGVTVPIFIDKFLIQRSALAASWLLGRKAPPEPQRLPVAQPQRT